MTTSQVAAMIASVGVPSAYHHFTDQTGIEPPFIVFYYDRSADFIADDTNYVKANSLIIEFCSDEKDFDLEKIIEDTLNANGLVYSRTETYIDSERMYMTVFSTSVIITEE